MEEKLDYNKQSIMLVAVFLVFFALGLVSVIWLPLIGGIIVIVVSIIVGAFVGSYKKWLYFGAPALGYAIGYITMLTFR